MLNKIFAILLVSFAVASCSSNQKDVETITSINESPKRILVDQTPKSEKAAVVYFDTDSSKLDRKAISTLKDRVLDQAKNSNTKRVVVEAHADERGARGYNQKLSERRANAVKDYLANNGVQNSKIKAIGFGEVQPVAFGSNEESWSKNRRAVTILIKK
ncbi:MAG: peptidoglycan-associated lipoprotein [Rickettsiales bacterium]|jgi:peptidoglycan-associated lipoprotein